MTPRFTFLGIRVMKIAVANKHNGPTVAEALADTGFDITAALCKLRDLFLGH